MHVEKRSQSWLLGATTQQMERIKEALTFDNPAYLKAKKYSKYKNVRVPPYLMYYHEDRSKKALIFPSGLNVCNILNVNCTVKVCTQEKKVVFPKFKLDLREDQKKAEQAYIEEVTHNSVPRSIVSMPTGKGKSILALHIAYTLKQKTLILVGKDDLVVSWTADIKQCFGNIEVGLVKAKKRKVGSIFTIATVQTLGRMSTEELEKYTEEFGLVVMDEVHHIGSNTFNIIDCFNSRYKLGLSATPFRTDGFNFAFDIFFGGVCFTCEVKENDEDISNVLVHVLNSNCKYRPFLYKGNVFNYYDYSENELPDNLTFLEDIPYKERPVVPFLTIDRLVVSSTKTKLPVCKKIVEHYRKGNSILVLFTQKEHILEYYRYLSLRIPKERIMCYYGDSKEKTADMIKKAENKDVLVTLATYAKTTEGTNVKSWEVLFLVSSLNNRKSVIQSTGRIRRRKKGKLDPVIVYDVRYTCYSLRAHFETRKAVYKSLNYKLVGEKSGSKFNNFGVFSRGYKR